MDSLAIIIGWLIGNLVSIAKFMEKGKASKPSPAQKKEAANLIK